MSLMILGADILTGTCLVGPVMWTSTFRTHLCKISESFSEWHLGAYMI